MPGGFRSSYRVHLNRDRRSGLYRALGCDGSGASIASDIIAVDIGHWVVVLGHANALGAVHRELASSTKSDFFCGGLIKSTPSTHRSWKRE